jgi:large subunit ribosomal protein L18
VSIKKKEKNRKKRRALVVRNRLRKHDSALPRVSVFRSLGHIYAQVIVDAQHATIASASSLTVKEAKGTKTEVAHAIGIEVAKKALEKGITKAAFDRGSCLYHGRVKALAEGLRAGGLEI